MPTTPGGLIYPSPTDNPDVPADMQALAESVEAGNAWVTTGFTAATNFTLSGTSRIRRVGSVCFVYLKVIRATSAISVAVDGECTNTACANIPSGYAPAFSQVLGSGDTGRLASFYVTPAGSLTLAATTPGSNIAIGDTLTIGGCYLLG